MELINLNSKKVFVFRTRPQFTMFLETNNTAYCFSKFYGNCILTDVKPSKLKKEFDYKIKNTVPKDGAVFLFDQTSKFPRFKLNATSYKRCIKKDRADFTIIADININNFSYKRIIQTKDAYYLFPNYVYFTWDPGKRYQSEYYDIDDFIIKYKDKLFSSEIINTWDYYLMQVSSPQIFIDVLTNKITNVLTDSMLDKIISETLEKLDYDKFKQIKSLIESPDKDNIGLGLRLLCNYNIEPMLNSINLLIAKHYSKITHVSEWTSTDVKQLRKKLYLPVTPIQDLHNLWSYIIKSKNSDDDIKCCGELFKEIALELINPTTALINNILSKSDLKLTFNQSFEQC